jgi:hypothetical protein
VLGRSEREGGAIAVSNLNIRIKAAIRTLIMETMCSDIDVKEDRQALIDFGRYFEAVWMARDLLALDRSPIEITVWEQRAKIYYDMLPKTLQRP